LRTNETKSKTEGVKNKGEGNRTCVRERETPKLREKQKRRHLRAHRKYVLGRSNPGLNFTGLFFFNRMKVSRK